jgi:hypothetical protein
MVAGIFWKDYWLQHAQVASDHHASATAAGVCRCRTTATYFTPSGASRQQQPRRASAVQDSPAGTPGTRSPPLDGGVFSPDSDSLPVLGDGAAAGIWALSGLSPSSAGDAVGVGALGLRSHARRLSQQALSEAGDRWADKDQLFSWCRGAMCTATTAWSADGSVFAAGTVADLLSCNRN